MYKASLFVAVSSLCLCPLAASAAPSSNDLDAVVVTPNRVATERRDVPANVEVIDMEDLAQTPAMFATDFLKKRASVDVIQYPGGRSGVGLRGFRPEFSGTNQRVLILIDGRPAGITSLGNLPMAGVKRVEVVKGSASAVYGSSAMGGVINFITRDSRGPVSGGVGIAAGSYETLRADAHAGGSLSSNLDFDVAFDERSQFDDYDLGSQSRTFADGFRQGGGVRRPFTSFETRSGYGRLGYRLSPQWRVDARGQLLRGNDIESPGAESDGQLNQGLSDIDVYGLDVSLTGQVGGHQPLARAYLTREAYDSHKAAQGKLRYHDSDRDTRFHGVQLRDAWQLNERWLWVYGLDYEEVSNTNRRYNADGQRLGPYTPDDERQTVGVYSELNSKWFDDRLIVNVGARYDEIENKALKTPYRDAQIPGSSRFDTFNPRLGVVLFPDQDRRWRLHSSAGRGFVAPLTRETSGRTEETVGQRLQIAYGNSDLDPETSTTYDFGAGYQAQAWSADLTWFLTRVEDKIETVILTSIDDLRETTYVNASQARAEGFEATLGVDLDHWLTRLPGSLRFTTTSTYYTKREQDLPDGREPLRNVARFKINAALDYEGRRFGARLAARHVDGMLDNDYSSGRYFSDGQERRFEFDSTTLVDADLRWYVTPHHTLGVQVENLFDRYYYEKGDYPGAGRLILASYSYGF